MRLARLGMRSQQNRFTNRALRGHNSSVGQGLNRSEGSVQLGFSGKARQYLLAMGSKAGKVVKCHIRMVDIWNALQAVYGRYPIAPLLYVC